MDVHEHVSGEENGLGKKQRQREFTLRVLCAEKYHLRVRLYVLIPPFSPFIFFSVLSENIFYVVFKS